MANPRKQPAPKSYRSAICEKNPWHSRSCGVHRSQVAEANAIAKKHGFSHEYDPKTGFAVATSPKGRNDAMRMQDMGDRDAGYGDYTG